MNFRKKVIVQRLVRRDCASANRELYSYEGTPGPSAIVCPRCNGRMVRHYFFGREGHFCGWRCVNCGEIMDPVINQNRRIWAGLPCLEEES